MSIKIICTSKVNKYLQHLFFLSEMRRVLSLFIVDSIKVLSIGGRTVDGTDDNTVVVLIVGIHDGWEVIS